MPTNKTRGNTCLSKRDTRPKAHIDIKRVTCCAGVRALVTIYAVLRAMCIDHAHYKPFSIYYSVVYM